MKVRGLISVLALLGCIGAYAAPQGEHIVSAKLGYPVGKTDVKADYRANGKAVSTLDNVLGSEASISRIEVVSSSSPEGSYSLNKRLAGERAFFAVQFLQERYGVSDSLFVVKTVDEDWNGVAAYLRRSDKPWKDEALKIIEVAGKNRKAQLQDLWVGEAWDDLMKNAFPGLRKTEVRVVLAAREQERDQILFRRGYRQLDLSQGNSATLEVVKKKIAGGYTGEIKVVGYSSPDGSAAANEKLSLARAQNVKDYIVSNLGYPPDKISVSSGGVDWEKFAATVEYSYYGDDKASVLEILRNQNLSSAQKKRALLALDGGSTWQALKGDQMLELCSVTVTLDDDMVPEEEEEKPVEEKPVVVEEPVVVVEEPVVKEQPEAVTEKEEPEKEAEEIPIEEEPVVVEPSVEVTVTEPVKESETIDKSAKPQKVLFGVGTNLLFDVVTGVNVSLDVPVGKHWDITADYIFPWWKDRNKSFVFQLAHIDLGARYYFKPWEKRDENVMRGWFASASVGAGYYDFALWNPTGVQGEEIKLSVGGGYTWALSPWWRLTAELGVGPVFSQYRIYNAEAPDRLVVQGQYSNVFLRPTAAKISLTYLLHTPVRAR